MRYPERLRRRRARNLDAYVWPGLAGQTKNEHQLSRLTMHSAVNLQSPNAAECVAGANSLHALRFPGPSRKDFGVNPVPCPYLLSAPLHFEALAAVQHLPRNGAVAVAKVEGNMGAGVAVQVSIEADLGERQRLMSLAARRDLARILVLPSQGLRFTASAKDAMPLVERRRAGRTACRSFAGRVS